MAGENTVSTMQGLFKKVFADKLLDLVPDYAILQKMIEFANSSKETGDFYAQPVNLAHESGFTYNGTAGTVVTLNGAQNGVMKEAQVYGSELILQGRLSYTALSRASKQGEKAFKKASSWKILDLNNAMRKRLEIAMLYGQTGVGTVETVTDLTGNVCEIVISAATWAGGIWAGAEGAKLDSFTTITKNNGSGDITITKVASDSRKLTATFVGTLSSEITAGDVLYFKGANAGSSVFNEMAGLSKIIQNSSTLFNIDAATYSLWAGTTVSSVGELTHGKLQDAVARAVNKGLMEKCVVLVSPKGWSKLNTDQAALRVYDSSYSSSKAENGAESLVFHAANGQLEVKSHPMVKDGDAFILPMDSISRIGSVDLTFGVPGFDEQFFTLVPNTNAVEVQCMADQAIFLEKPAHAVFLTGITYS